MIYSEKYRTKWHDTDAARRVRPSTILMYMQETANRQLEIYGPKLEELRDRDKKGFILTRLSLCFYDELHAYDDIEVETWITDSRGLAFNRCFRIRRGDEIIAEAFSVWALLDLESRKFIRSEDFHYNFDGEAPLDLKIPMRIKFPQGVSLTDVGERKIAYSDIDYNMHMNNTKYPDMLCDFIPDMDKRKIKGMSLSFVHESAFGKTLKITSCESDGIFYFRTLDSDGTTCLEAEVVTE